MSLVPGLGVIVTPTDFVDVPNGTHARDRSPGTSTLLAEIWILMRCGDRALFCGVTNHQERRDRLRRYLLEQGLAHAVAGRRHGRDELWCDVFRRVYGEEL